MKAFLKKNYPIIVMNVLLTVICFGLLLYTLTYRQVPIQSQHLWYGDNLHTYLIFTHLLDTVLWFIGTAIINIYWYVKVK